MKSDRKEQEKMMQQMREIAKNNPDKIAIVEINVDAKIQIEFFETLQKIENKKSVDKNIEDLNLELLSTTTSIERKKEILTLLVTFGEVDSYRLIEKYLEHPDNEIKTWTYIAYQQAKMFLESKLLEESKIYIASGLGGKAHRLRYSFALSTNQDSFNKYQKDIIKGELSYFFKKEDCILEDIYYEQQYAIATALIPIHIDLIDLLQSILKEINEYGNFVNPNVFITNEKKIELDDIKDAFDNSEFENPESNNKSIED